MSVTDAMTMTLLVTAILTFYVVLNAAVDALRHRRLSR